MSLINRETLNFVMLYVPSEGVLEPSQFGLTVFYLQTVLSMFYFLVHLM
jgi:hypothetical protein